jgi:opacity protein-like surface antigen
MWNRWWSARVLILLLAVPASLTAQEKPFTFHAAGVVTAPLSGTADSFNPGFGVAAGATWNVDEQRGVRFDYAWSTLTPKDVPASVGQPLDIGANVQYATLTFVFQAPPGRARIYLLGGLGVYRRSVSISSSASGTATVCNPWWFVCEDGPVPVSQVTGSRSTTDLGVNLGFGVSVGRVFAEIRYHYATGPTFSTPQGEQQATGKFLPLMVGVRF